MKIVFITSSLEAGRDGVGDYTRRLAAECIRQGHPSLIVGLNDSHVARVRSDTLEFEDLSVSALRLPGNMAWNRRIGETRDWLNGFSPDWFSLQFVAFGFHRKGLCFRLGHKLSAMDAKMSWHVMFHELWLGLGASSSLKHRVWGHVQRNIIRDLLRRLRPRLVHTQAEPYRAALSREKVESSILPLFGNVPYIKGEGWDLLMPLIAKAVGHSPGRRELYLAGVFGAVHPEWDPEQAVNTLLPLVQRSGKRLVLVFHGRNNLSVETFEKLKSTLRNRADVVATGERNSSDISSILQTMDLGLATSPIQIIQKSGSVATMLEHGLEVLVTRDDWRLRWPMLQSMEVSSALLSPKQFARLETLPARNPHVSAAGAGVSRVAGQLLAAMKSRL